MITPSTTVQPGTDDAVTIHPPETPPGSSSGSTFRQLTRTPLVPEAVLKHHGAFCAIDTRFRSAARLLQCLWLKDQDIPTASSARRGSINAGSAFGSILDARAARAGRNFLSPAIHRLSLQELLLREDDAAIDEERLFGNALSSVPLTFNLFGPLAIDHALATDVFRRLLPDVIHSVERIIFEHSPGRREDRFLTDRTAFDLAVRVTTPEGEAATVFIEVKYSESMEGPAARMRDRYNEASRQVRLYRDPDSAILRSLALEQLWREHMLAQLAVDHGVTPRAFFLVIGPRLNRRVQAACQVYDAELVDADQRDPDRVAFAPLTLETVIEAIAAAGAPDLAQALWARYCDLDRVYRLSMQELAGGDNCSSPSEPSIASRRALPPPRRSLSPSSRRCTNRVPTRAKRTSGTTKQAVA
ncbi:PGN_0703 family putative restriction endonuclease [Bradyrhizobium sp. SZCCHNS2002]|uniref:PGN_0703 family putative restriction endonuclease n=1 Tax=Bradyrhizobium sp. SZCCHNS2002 TaxID=3057302 RepID=UPI002916F476|nr:hypothetical protein [Bradyrhizobium sp. SZCCHNS2002]